MSVLVSFGVYLVIFPPVGGNLYIQGHLHIEQGTGSEDFLIVL